MHEKLQIGAKSMHAESSGLEKKLEKAVEERERLAKDLEATKAERDKKLDEARRQFEREKDVLK